MEFEERFTPQAAQDLEDILDYNSSKKKQQLFLQQMDKSIERIKSFIKTIGLFNCLKFLLKLYTLLPSLLFTSSQFGIRKDQIVGKIG